MNFIEKLQNKPRFMRIQILWISVILIMIIIISLWSVYLKSSLQLSNANQKSQSQLQGQTAPSLFNTIREDFLFFKKSLQAKIGGIINSNEEGNKFEVEILEP